MIESISLKSTWKNYDNYKRELIESYSLSQLRILKWVAIALLIANYLLSFSEFYIFVYKYIPIFAHELIFIIYPMLSDIKNDMISHGDEYLYYKYFVFSLINFSTVLLSIFISFILVKTNNANLRIPYLIGCFLHLFAVIILFFITVTMLNEAGYSNPRFPIYPWLGKGVFFFARDTGFFYLITWGVIELIVIARLLFKQAMLKG